MLQMYSKYSLHANCRVVECFFKFFENSQIYQLCENLQKCNLVDNMASPQLVMRKSVIITAEKCMLHVFTLGFILL